MLAQAHAVTNSDDPIGRLISAGDHREAISRCVREYGATIGRMCMVFLGSQSDAEEVVQETMLAAHRGMASFRGEGTAKAWLFGIARRQCARRLEMRRRHERHLFVVDEASGDDPADAVATKRRAVMLRAALAQLKPSERDALVLRYHGDLSFREISEICGIDEAAARKRASRGLQRLRTLIDREGME